MFTQRYRRNDTEQNQRGAGMSKTCADCARHECTNICTTIRRSCDGRCSLRNSHRKCDRTKCKEYVIDKFFEQKEITNDYL